MAYQGEQDAEVDYQDRRVDRDVEEAVFGVARQPFGGCAPLSSTDATHGNSVASKLKKMAFVAESQNWNSGNRLMNGLNSSSSPSPRRPPLPGLGEFAVGRPGAPSSTSCSARSCSSDGSNLGCRKARKRSAVRQRSVSHL